MFLAIRHVYFGELGLSGLQLQMIQRQTSAGPVCVTASAALLRGSAANADVRDGPLARRGPEPGVSGCDDTLVSCVTVILAGAEPEARRGESPGRTETLPD